MVLHNFAGWTFLLSVVGDFTASACPALCKCFTEDVVHCNKVGLRNLPEGLPATATSLNLAGNLLCILSFNYFQNISSIYTLWLDHNNLTFIYPGAFLSLTELRDLNLSTNTRLTHLHAHTFRGLINLISLDLSDCNIFEIHPHVFSHLASLEILDLTSNKMRYVPQAFGNLLNLTWLSMEKNNIEAVGKNSFMFQASMRALNLRKNRIWAIQSEAFIHLNKLSVLNLGHNNISDLPNLLFEGLILLKTLHLEANRITAIHCSFSNLPRLRRLYLNNNRITYISKNAFASLKELEFVHLSKNNLTSLPDPLFDRQPKLRYVFLASNPWNCDCDMAWLLRWNVSRPGVIDGWHCNFSISDGRSPPDLFSPELSSCSSLPDQISNTTGNYTCEEAPTNTAHRLDVACTLLVVFFWIIENPLLSLT